jgi:hypothetical protein
MKPAFIQNLFSVVSHFSKREKLIFYGAIVFISLALVDRVLVRSFGARLNSLDQEIIARQADIKRSIKILAQKKKIDSQSADYSAYIGSESSENEQFTALSKEILNLAQKASIYLIDVKSAGVKELEKSKKFLVNLICEGKMEQIAAFMYRVETFDRLLTVEKYQINPKSKDTDTAKCSMVISQLVIP